MSFSIHDVGYHTENLDIYFNFKQKVIPSYVILIYIFFIRNMRGWRKEYFLELLISMYV